MLKNLLVGLLLVGVVGFVVGCDDDDDAVNPTPNSDVALMAVLAPQAAAPLTGGSSGSAVATLVLNAARDEVSFSLAYGGLTGDPTAAHFHNAAAGSSVVRHLPMRVANTYSDTWSKSDATDPLTDSLIQNLLSGELYFVIHTSANPGGEIFGTIMEVTSGTPFMATLDVDQVVAPSAGGPPPRSGNGTGFFVLNGAEDELMYYIVFDGLSAPGMVTNAHFHRGAVGVNGGVAHGIFDNLNGNLFSGTWTEVDAQSVTELKASELYINIHTSNYTSGEIRGQVVPQL